MKVNKLALIIASVLLVAAIPLLAKPKKAASNDDKIKIIAAIFPAYDWTKQIIGENASDISLSLLLDNGVDLHNFEPTVQDIAKISNADIFIYVGGESDDWVEDVLKTAKNKNLIALNLLEVLGEDAKQEEIVEGMEADDDEEEADEDDIEYDEHVWLSIKNAKLFCSAITNAISKKDKEHKDDYTANLNAYLAKLDSLDALYKETIRASKRNTLVFGDRFPFRYLVDDYNLKYYAAFVGCSAETEASFKTIAFLSQKINELNLQYICKIETGDNKISRTIIQNSNNKKAKILTLDSMQSTTAKDIKKLFNFFYIYGANLA